MLNSCFAFYYNKAIPNLFLYVLCVYPSAILDYQMICNYLFPL
jgi:hypothetical protein